MYSFNYNENDFYGYANQSTAPATAPIRMATDGQLAKYRELCAEKRQPVQDTAGWSHDQASAEISRLISFRQASDPQRDKIQAKLADLKALGITLDISDEQINTLTGGREGTASQLIQQLIDLEQRNLDKAKPNENHLRTLVSWYLCPDMPFEQYGISLTVPTDLVIEGRTYRRHLLPEEFAREIMAHMNFQQARDFINAHRAAFHEWKKTRITLGQIARVRQLENRMANIANPKITDLAIDLVGEPVMIQIAADKGTSWSPNAYMPIEDAQLMMYSRKEATRLIAQLESELNDKSITKFPDESGLQDAVERLRTVNSADKAQQSEFEQLNNIMYALMAATGQRDDSFEHGEVRLVVERWDTRDGDTQVIQLIEDIFDFMNFALDGGYIGEDGLQQLVSKSRIASTIADCAW